MLAYINCQICASNCHSTDFKIFFCGHGFCASCVDSLFKTSPTKCPTCRRALQRKDVQTIFLDLVVVNPKEIFVDTVCEGLARMDENSPMDSIRRTADKLDKGAKRAREDKDLTNRLLDSIEDFKRRILPVFETAASQVEDIRRLEGLLANSARTHSALEREHRKCIDLSAKVSSLEAELTSATDLAERANTIAQQLNDKITNLTNERDYYQQAFQDEEKRRKDIAGRDAASAGVLKRTREKYEKVKEEMKALKEEHEHLRHEHQQSQLVLSSLPREAQDQDDDDNETTSHHTPRHRVATENQPIPDFEGLPRPGAFGSNWNGAQQRTRNYGALTKVKVKPATLGHRRVANPAVLNLDSKGKPKTAVQLGPIRSLRI